MTALLHHRRPAPVPAAASRPHEDAGHGQYDASCGACVHLLAHALGHGSYVTLGEELRATAGHPARCDCR